MTINSLQNLAYSSYSSVKSAIDSTSAKTFELAKPIFKQMYQHPCIATVALSTSVIATPYPYNLAIGTLSVLPFMVLTTAAICKKVLIKNKEITEKELTELCASRNQLANSTQCDQADTKTSLDKVITNLETSLKETDLYLKDITKLEEFLKS